MRNLQEVHPQRRAIRESDKSRARDESRCWRLPMAGLEPARACYGPTDFKSVASTISPHRRCAKNSKLVARHAKINFRKVVEAFVSNAWGKHRGSRTRNSRINSARSGHLGQD